MQPPVTYPAYPSQELDDDLIPPIFHQSSSQLLPGLADHMYYEEQGGSCNPALAYHRDSRFGAEPWTSMPANVSWTPTTAYTELDTPSSTGIWEDGPETGLGPQFYDFTPSPLSSYSPSFDGDLYAQTPCAGYGSSLLESYPQEQQAHLANVEGPTHSLGVDPIYNEAEAAFPISPAYDAMPQHLTTDDQVGWTEQGHVPFPADHCFMHDHDGDVGVETGFAGDVVPRNHSENRNTPEEDLSQQTKSLVYQEPFEPVQHPLAQFPQLGQAQVHPGTSMDYTAPLYGMYDQSGSSQPIASPAVAHGECTTALRDHRYVHDEPSHKVVLGKRRAEEMEEEPAPYGFKYIRLDGPLHRIRVVNVEDRWPVYAFRFVNIFPEHYETMPASSGITESATEVSRDGSGELTEADTASDTTGPETPSVQPEVEEPVGRGGRGDFELILGIIVPRGRESDLQSALQPVLPACAACKKAKAKCRRDSPKDVCEYVGVLTTLFLGAALSQATTRVAWEQLLQSGRKLKSPVPDVKGLGNVAIIGFLTVAQRSAAGVEKRKRRLRTKSFLSAWVQIYGPSTVEP
ncbi:hypothetical protein CERSUDRAFT_69833 [Gelatoporia subvermispora B]|uniref:Uncharacterized protein n=1 Tax=Ceriporiopsis subvermispora (strain B) TaxID=914234 RepID=M2PWM3_CERS8|nr:hypothetical protein CERSUDRAFT_69833 [Gelatoporia subvermispora B]